MHKLHSCTWRLCAYETSFNWWPSGFFTSLWTNSKLPNGLVKLLYHWLLFPPQVLPEHDLCALLTFAFLDCVPLPLLLVFLARALEVRGVLWVGPWALQHWPREETMGSIQKVLWRLEHGVYILTPPVSCFSHWCGLITDQNTLKRSLYGLMVVWW